MPWVEWEVVSYCWVAIDGFTVSFDRLAYRFYGFDSGGIDQFELEDGVDPQFCPFSTCL